MNIETIELRKIIAPEGMILTDGECYGKVIFLSDDANISKWYEITEEEYAEILRLEAEENMDDNFEIIDENQITPEEFFDMIREVL